jgi:hypothetical protein
VDTLSDIDAYTARYIDAEKIVQSAWWLGAVSRAAPGHHATLVGVGANRLPPFWNPHASHEEISSEKKTPAGLCAEAMLAARALLKGRAAFPGAARLAGAQRAMAGGFDPPRYKRDFSPDLVVEGIADDPMSQPKVYEKDIWKNPESLVREHAERMRNGPWSLIFAIRFFNPPPPDSFATIQPTAWRQLVGITAQLLPCSLPDHFLPSLHSLVHVADSFVSPLASCAHSSLCSVLGNFPNFAVNFDRILTDSGATFKSLGATGGVGKTLASSRTPRRRPFSPSTL